MTKDRLNGLTVIFIHKDIVLDYDPINNDFANKHPRKVLIVNPLEYLIE